MRSESRATLRRHDTGSMSATCRQNSRSDQATTESAPRLTNMNERRNKVVVWMQMSLDGQTQGPHGEFDWAFVREELHGFIVETLRDAGMFLYGRRVYEIMATFWPTADQDPNSNQFQVAYSKLWKPMPKLVFSRTLETSDWNTTVARKVERTVIDEAHADGGDLYLFGGAEVVAAFAQHDLVDEYQIFVHPVVLGGGTPLFPQLAGRQQMRLVETRVFDDTVVGLRYSRKR